MIYSTLTHPVKVRSPCQGQNKLNSEAVGLQLRDDFAMPANNELLVFVRGICEP